MAQPNSSTVSVHDDSSANLLWTSPVWSTVLRALGFIAAVFLFLLAYKQGVSTAGGIFRTVLYGLSGLLLILPWNRFATRWWKWLFAFFVLTMGILVFAQIVEVLSLYSSVSQPAEVSTEQSLFQQSTGSLTKETKPRPPIDRGIILFFALLQIPVVLFRRYPDILK